MMSNTLTWIKGVFALVGGSITAVLGGWDSLSRSWFYSWC
jgi:hypothetical protein